MIVRSPGSAAGPSGGFDWPPDAGSGTPADEPSSAFPATGPLAEFRARADVLSRPSSEEDAASPWVLASGARVVKAYNLAAFDPLDQRQMLAEAEAARAVSDVRDVVTTYRTGTIGGWLVIEMERLGDSVADYLDSIAVDLRTPISPQRWGELFEQAAAALDEIHSRGLTHHDIKPANLMFDRDERRLVIADFSIASRRRRRPTLRSQRDTPAEVRGTDRYIAPEQFDGRVGPKVDQYALAVTARDVLGDEISEQTKRVLLRATSQDPADRYPTTSDFGGALREALDDTLPRRVSSRLQRVKPAARHAWGPGAWAAIALWGLLIYFRDPDLTPWVALGLPLLLGVAVISTTALISGHRSTRTQPRAAIADRSWFPLVVFIALAAVLWPIVEFDVKANAKFWLYAAGAALVLTARLGSVPRDAGDWLIGLVRRWERRREAHRGNVWRWWGARAAILVAIAAIAWLPVVVGDLWPRPSGTSPVHAGPLIVVADVRATMAGARPEPACRRMRIPATSGKVPCATWIALAGKWLKAEFAAHRGAVFVPAHLRDVTFRKGRSLVAGQESWDLLRGSGDNREDLGDLTRRAGTRVWEVSVTRAADRRDPLKSVETIWRYETIRTQRGWAITAVAVCDYTVGDPCVTLSQIRRSELDAVVRRGPPG